MPMKMSKINKLISTAEQAIMPVSAGLTIARKPLEAFSGGGVSGLINLAKKTIRTWHPPTLKTLESLIDSEFGDAAVTTVVAAGANWIIDMLPLGKAKSPVKRLVGAVGNGAAGTMIGKFGEALIFPTEYNPGPTRTAGRRSTGQLSQQNMRPGAAGWTRANIDPKRAKYAKPEHPVRPR